MSNTTESDLASRRKGWEWEDGTTYDCPNYHEWSNEEPTDGYDGDDMDINCARMKDRKWMVDTCRNEYGCLCEKPSKFHFTFAITNIFLPLRQNLCFPSPELIASSRCFQKHIILDALSSMVLWC